MSNLPFPKLPKGLSTTKIPRRLPTRREIDKVIETMAPDIIRPIARTAVSKLADITYPAFADQDSESEYEARPGNLPGEDEISREHEQEEAELELMARGGEMEKMEVPVFVTSPVSSRGNRSDGTRSPSSTMSDPVLVGSEFLEPMLAESEYGRRAMEGSEHFVKETETLKPWGYADFMRKRGGGAAKNNAEDTKKQDMAKKPSHPRVPRLDRPMHGIEASAVYKAPQTEAQRLQRARIEQQWKAKGERQIGGTRNKYDDMGDEMSETEMDNALIDSMVFEPTIPKGFNREFRMSGSPATRIDREFATGGEARATGHAGRRVARAESSRTSRTSRSSNDDKGGISSFELPE